MDLEQYNVEFFASTALYAINYGRERCRPSHKFGPNKRTFYLIHYIVSGKGKYYVNGKIYNLRAGDVFLICPGDTITYIADASDPWHYYWVAFSGGDAKELLKKCNFSRDNHVFNCESAKDKIISLVESRKDPTFNEYMTVGYLYLFLAELVKKDGATENSALNLALKYISDNFSYDLTVESIAQAVYLSRSQLFRLFKERLGVSPSEYIITFRILKARSLLTETSHSVSDIGTYCGFNSGTAFCRAFKRKFDVSPQKYRE